MASWRHCLTTVIVATLVATQLSDQATRTGSTATDEDTGSVWDTSFADVQRVQPLAAASNTGLPQLKVSGDSRSTGSRWSSGLNIGGIGGGNDGFNLGGSGSFNTKLDFGNSGYDGSVISGLSSLTKGLDSPGTKPGKSSKGKFMSVTLFEMSDECTLTLASNLFLSRSEVCIIRSHA